MGQPGPAKDTKPDDTEPTGIGNLRLKDEKDKEDDDDKTATIIKKYLESPSTSAHEAAIAVDKKVRVKRWIKSDRDWINHVNNSMIAFWWGVWDLASDIPHKGEKMEKLVAFVYALTKLPPTPLFETEEGPTWEKLWTDLPWMGFEILDNFTPPGARDDAMERKKFQWMLAENTFTARMFENHPEALEGLGTAIYVLKDTLEEEVRDKQNLADLVMLAEIWIRHCREYYLSYIPGNADRVKHKEYPKSWRCGGRLYHGEVGISQERWDFWKNRFLELSNCLEGDAKQAALDAAAIM